MKRLQSRARVQVTLDIAVADVWGADCPMEQIWRQARESALRAIANGLGPGPLPVVGEPKITAVLVEEER
jgi:hypothetical protein